MKKWKKITLIVGALVLIAVVIVVSVNRANSGVVAVQTGEVKKQDLVSLVTASGEIRPLVLSNVLGEGFGKITQIAIKEGDKVRKGDVLLRVENIQPTADVEAQRAALSSTESAVKAAEAGYRSAQAELTQRQADFQKSKFDWERAQQLFKDELISKQEYDAGKAAFDSASASIEVSEARVAQTRAEMERSRSVLNQNSAMLTRARDQLRKTTYTAPINGTVTYIPVHVGENVIAGVVNSTAGSYLMTIADMSVVTAEVKVDETDIINVRQGQKVDITIDALPGQTFHGRVIEVGSQAVLRTSGLATTQTTAGTQEAKDFKVVITLDDPPESLRPGLSTTAKIKTAERDDVLAIPMQALAVRTRADLEEAQKEAEGKGGGAGVTLAASKAREGTDPKKEEIQGVFVVRGGKAEFVEVKTGITGITDIEVLSGLQEGDEIVTGSYRALRTLRPGARIKKEEVPSGVGGPT
ncbi:MAG: efflux RND transporter periplasmic adaptor subunit [Candidatus Acidiferrales bacterium]